MRKPPGETLTVLAIQRAKGRAHPELGVWGLDWNLAMFRNSVLEEQLMMFLHKKGNSPTRLNNLTANIIHKKCPVTTVAHCCHLSHFSPQQLQDDNLSHVIIASLLAIQGGLGRDTRHYFLSQPRIWSQPAPASLTMKLPGAGGQSSAQAESSQTPPPVQNHHHGLGGSASCWGETKANHFCNGSENNYFPVAQPGGWIAIKYRKNITNKKYTLPINLENKLLRARNH